MKLHEIASKRSTLETLVVTTAEMIENITHSCIGEQ